MSCLDLQNFRSLESGDVHQNFWSSESLSPQKLETFIRTSGLQNLWHLIRNATSEAGTILQNFLSQNLQLGFWAYYQNLQKLTCIRVRNSVFRSAADDII